MPSPLLYYLLLRLCGRSRVKRPLLRVIFIVSFLSILSFLSGLLLSLRFADTRLLPDLAPNWIGSLIGLISFTLSVFFLGLFGRLVQPNKSLHIWHFHNLSHALLWYMYLFPLIIGGGLLALFLLPLAFTLARQGAIPPLILLTDLLLGWVAGLSFALWPIKGVVKLLFFISTVGTSFWSLQHYPQITPVLLPLFFVLVIIGGLWHSYHHILQSPTPTKPYVLPIPRPFISCGWLVTTFLRHPSTRIDILFLTLFYTLVAWNIRSLSITPELASYFELLIGLGVTSLAASLAQPPTSIRIALGLKRIISTHILSVLCISLLVSLPLSWVVLKGSSSWLSFAASFLTALSFGLFSGFFLLGQKPYFSNTLLATGLSSLSYYLVWRFPSAASQLTHLLSR